MRYIYAMGLFDGVHLGHQLLLRECVKMAGQQGALAAAMTFDRHPQARFCPQPPLLITQVADREFLLKSYGAEKILLLPVTEEVMSTNWQDFLEGLVREGCVGFVCGSDFRFGRGGEGNGEKLESFCRQRNLLCTIVPEQRLDGQRISSTHIRTLLEKGETEEAARFLGHPHLLSGKVVSGKQLGRTMGIPTANLRLPEGVLPPKFGVYACLAEFDGKKMPAVTNVGVRPTVAGKEITVESWILGYDGQLYGKNLRLWFYRYLRQEKKFPDLTALGEEIRKNGEETLKFFEKM